ncbi:MAG: 3-methyladenine DNA glycosylase [Corynebacterium sp.]|uniref:3-methyladenine DNA glycosylase n=1 Tax=Corynebacterium sp. TaxID=1720 RepID=UPI0026DC1EFF|nr:3-methyladenine DNA glycosylase [Corynebacterium sp.]MDO5029002.1 3-methyladenine DNA glycosylase [Corynebacterium sp.]
MAIAHNWREAKAQHEARVEELTRDHLHRRSRGQRHPVWDFIFDYYPIKPGQLRRWSPGIGVDLPGATAADIRHLKYFTLDSQDAVADTATATSTARMDVAAYVVKRGKTVAYIGNLLRATRANPAHFDCFGLHEWAMVYRQPEHRHPEPLRLGQAGTDEVVDAHTVRCTHFDAFRFFTPDAVPLNEFAPTRATQPNCEQMGCLHANMDLYKWASKLGEAVPGELWLDTFELACAARELDMRAAPYDLRDWGFDPIRIETPEGKAEYVRQQREISARADVLRGRLLQVVDAVLAAQ